VGGEEVSGRIGPIDIDLPTGQILAIVFGLIVFSSVGKALALWLRSRTTRSWELRQRIRALRLLLNADYEYTTRLSPSELQALVGGHIGSAAGGLSIIGQVVNAAISFSILVSVAFATSPLAAVVIAVVGGTLLFALRPLAARSRVAGRASSEQG